ncbi:type II toxin-antitoxin system HipA family toxin [uncultured Arthrobacter sp.]|uniref:type II toxin-antitoxin system HipA family toxin n=1 Tax=uncultured Arthrobacter sp. TaxID=114050 RepID=UPI00261547E9|nr:HipA domain-containing protein [uncultured Arthrobacter sp.]
MTSKAYVWVWLPGTQDPVVAGRIDETARSHSFTYGRSYVEREDSLPLYLPELPLIRGTQRPHPSWEAHGCIQDAGPDYWGRRVILAKHYGHLRPQSDTDDLPFLSYLLESGSDRIGALDFQRSPTEYVARTYDHQADLSDLLSASDRIEAGERLPPALEEAIFRGTSIGGARPKALLDDAATGTRLIAKFSSKTDNYPVIKAEALAMKLASDVGINVAPTRIESVHGRDVLLVERFDRGENGERKMLVSALTILGEQPMTGHYCTYPDLADQIRERFTDARATLHELFRRIVFNVVIGNTDDHARNHAAFWDGNALTLTPAYDLCPQPRSGGEVTHALAIGRDGDKRSRLEVCEKAAPVYLLDRLEARAIIEHTVSVVKTGWREAADAVALSEVDRERLRGGALLNPSIWYQD